MVMLWVAASIRARTMFVLSALGASITVDSFSAQTVAAQQTYRERKRSNQPYAIHSASIPHATPSVMQLLSWSR